MSRLPVPPGLTCATCRQPFRRALARRTRAGWTHAAECVSPETLTEGRWVNRRGIQRWEAA